MAIRIEALSASGGSITAAFYYPVPTPMQEPAAIDPARVASGKRLSAPELQDLKDGKLFEIVRSFTINGLTGAQVRSELEAAWTAYQGEAGAEYKARFVYAGKAFDSATGWS